MQRNNNGAPVISVCIITYNQVDYISECINSVLSQQGDFSFEVIIGDDGSSDGTRGIVEKFAQQNSNILALTGAPNLGVKKNLKRVLMRARGRYVALVEGDDYWHDANKLQKQLDYMRCNPAYVLCFTAARVELKFFHISKILTLPTFVGESSIEIRKKLWSGWFGVHTCTMLFTHEFIQMHMNSSFFREDLISGDWPLAMHAAIVGDIGFLTDRTATYRIASGSVMNSGVKMRLQLIREQAVWWTIFKEKSDNPWVARVPHTLLIEQRMKGVGYVPANPESKGIRIDGVGNFRFSIIHGIKFRLRSSISPLLRWLGGEVKDSKGLK